MKTSIINKHSYKALLEVQQSRYQWFNFWLLLLSQISLAVVSFPLLRLSIFATHSLPHIHIDSAVFSNWMALYFRNNLKVDGKIVETPVANTQPL